MGLRDLLSRWTKGEKQRAVERAELEARMDPHDRAVDQEDFEARKDDVVADSRIPGAVDVGLSDLEPPERF